MPNDSSAQKMQSEHLQITKTPSDSGPTGKVLEFHVIIQSANLPGYQVNAACHASNLDIKDVKSILWSISSLIDFHEPQPS